MDAIKFYNYLFDDWSMYEIILNILFIILLIIISVLIYWDTINRNIINKSRCLKFNDLLNEGVFKLIVKNNKGVNLFEIEYDFKKQETRFGKFFLPKGSVVNDITINKFPYWNFVENELSKYNIIKTSKFDKNYFENLNGDFSTDNFIFDGEPKLISFIKNTATTDFFNEIKAELAE